MNLLIALMVFISPIETFYPTKMVFPDKTVYTNTVQVDIFTTKIVLKDNNTYFQKTFFIEDSYPNARNHMYICKNGYLIEVHHFQNGEIRKITISDNNSTLTLLKAIHT